MTTAPSIRRRALAVAAAALLVALVTVHPSAAGAASPAAGPAAAWLAELVGPGGSVENPYAPGAPSATWTVNVALSLAATGTEPAALEATLGWIAGNVDAYIVRGGTDNPGALGYLILLVTASGGDPTAFGTPVSDLVARLTATLSTSEPGLFGEPDAFAAATNQSLALLALAAAGAPVPAVAVQWLVDQQCDAPAAAAGGWQGYRAPAGATLEACLVPDPSAFSGPDTNTTAFAVQALVAVGSPGPVPDALAFLRTGQATTGARTGGFGTYPPGGADPNSTAVVLQALVAAGEQLADWAPGGVTPLTSLESWVIGDGPDVGALSSPFSEGFSDPFATYQGVWGLALRPFPFATPAAPPVPVVPVAPEPDAAGPSAAVTATPVTAAPRFTG
ncbi:MAG: hypothetical protein MUE36_05530 [Acidimicrobiales bacterium]|jgi:hypothetical protein|nr:hypothetical protein [Acidimicrobiales bacterium]